MFTKTRLILVALLLLGSGLAFAWPLPPTGNGRVLLVAYDGADDGQRMTALFRHAAAMRMTGKLADVAVLLHGRAVSLAAEKNLAFPAEARQALETAHSLGIPIYVCETALGLNDINPDGLIPQVRKVPFGAEMIADFISQGWIPLQY